MPTFIVVKNGQAVGGMKGASPSGLKKFLKLQVEGIEEPEAQYIVDFYTP